MKEIILKVLQDVSTDRQLNLQAESAREMIADELDKNLQIYLMQLVEEIVVGTPPQANKVHHESF
jgi:hypothetical protein